MLLWAYYLAAWDSSVSVLVAPEYRHMARYFTATGPETLKSYNDDICKLLSELREGRIEVDGASLLGSGASSDWYWLDIINHVISPHPPSFPHC